MKKKQFLYSGIVAASLLSPFVSAAGIDVGFKIDESGSMTDEILNVKANVQTIADGLPPGSKAAVVGFGASGGGAPTTHCGFLDPNTMAFQDCVDELVASGSVEPGYDAVVYAVDNLTFTPGAPYCNILISDEFANDGFDPQPPEDLAAAIAAMTGKSGIFFGIVPFGIMVPSDQQNSYQPIADATGGQLFNLNDFTDDAAAQEVLAAVIQACVVATEGRMTGGGRVTGHIENNHVANENGDGIRVTHGFELHCNPANLPNNLEVNWAGNRFHLEELTTARCTDDPDYDEGKPVAGFDTYTGSGIGRLNGVSGATVEFIFTDQGEPGKADDTVIMTIKDDNDVEVLSVADSLNQGNQQAHR